MLRSLFFILPALFVTSLLSAQPHQRDWSGQKERTLRVEHRESENSEKLSGYLINDSLLLTAAHGVARYSRKDTVIYMGKMKLSTYVAKYLGAAAPEQVSVYADDRTYRVKAVHIHPRFKEDQAADLALLVLADTVKVSTAAAQIVPAALGDTLALMGYGSHPDDDDQPRRRDLQPGFNRVSALDTSGLMRYVQKRDQPTEPCNAITSAGDSGSPVWLIKKGQCYLVGTVKGSVKMQIKEGKMLDFDPYGQVVPLSRYADWLQSYTGNQP